MINFITRLIIINYITVLINLYKTPINIRVIFSSKILRPSSPQQSITLVVAIAAGVLLSKSLQDCEQPMDRCGGVYQSVLTPHVGVNPAGVESNCYYTG